jgi:hypothetical protein
MVLNRGGASIRSTPARCIITERDQKFNPGIPLPGAIRQRDGNDQKSS